MGFLWSIRYLFYTNFKILSRETDSYTNDKHIFVINLKIWFPRQCQKNNNKALTEKNCAMIINTTAISTMCCYSCVCPKTLLARILNTTQHILIVGTTSLYVKVSKENKKNKRKRIRSPSCCILWNLFKINYKCWYLFHVCFELAICFSKRYLKLFIIKPVV